MTITHPTTADELNRLAQLASRMETLGEDDAVILRAISRQVAHQLDVLQSDCDGKAGAILAMARDNDHLARENATLARDVCRLNGVIRELQGDLDVAQQENSRLEFPDRED